MLLKLNPVLDYIMDKAVDNPEIIIPPESLTCASILYCELNNSTETNVNPEQISINFTSEENIDINIKVNILISDGICIRALNDINDSYRIKNINFTKIEDIRRNKYFLIEDVINDSGFLLTEFDFRKIQLAIEYISK